MESSLTPLEMDAVLQLIQLSAADSQVFWLKLAAAKEETKQPMEGDENREESVGETSSSTVINLEKLLEEALPRRRKRFLPIADIYGRTKPLITNRNRNRPL